MRGSFPFIGWSVCAGADRGESAQQFRRDAEAD